MTNDSPPPIPMSRLDARLIQLDAMLQRKAVSLEQYQAYVEKAYATARAEPSPRGEPA